MSNIENFDIRSHIIDAIVDVFNTMVSMEVEFFDSEPPETTGTGRMVATVNFAGNVVGLINIQVDSALIGLMMVGGNLKSALNDAGCRCAISTPCLTHGTDFTIKSLKMEGVERFIFTHQENYIFVEVSLNTRQVSGDGDERGTPDVLAQLSDAAISKMHALNINALVSEAVIDVFDTMLSLKLEPADAVTAKSLEGIRNAGSVSFAGDATGMVSIHVADGFSREMAAEMLGRKVEEIEGDEEIGDMLTEMGNIVGENLKSAFADAGLICALSVPSFTSGTDFKIEALNMENYERFAFRCGENIIFVEMGVNVSDHPQVSEKPDESTAAEPEQPPIQAEKKASAETQYSKTPEDVDLDLLLDVPLEIKVELGRTRIEIRKLQNLTPGSAIKLIKLAGEPVDILVNDTLIARGDVIVQNEKYGIRVTEITSRLDRIRSFGI
jgi:flagellar motor switch protein FliN/FliY